VFRNPSAPSSAEAQPQRIYSAREAAKLFSVSLATWNRYVAANLVPRPIQLGPRRVGWLEGELAAAQQAWRERRDKSVT
jgi:predicted DNA-binding transcriptional regulator AlpA